MTITITAFETSPDRGRGLARDMRVRWALEELGLPYKVRLLAMESLKDPAYLAEHPFGQIPTLQDGDLTLFETGAILLHLAEGRPGLLPVAAGPRARAIMWIFAALNTVEPPVVEFSMSRILEGGESWHPQRHPQVVIRLKARLDQLAVRLGSAGWLEPEGFTAGDLMMISVLLRLKPSGMLEDFPALATYVARGEARPAYQRAFAAQLEVFRRSQKGE